MSTLNIKIITLKYERGIDMKIHSKAKFNAKVIALTIGGILIWLLLMALSAWILMIGVNVVLSQINIKSINYSTTLVFVLLISFIIEYIRNRKGDNHE